MRNIPRYVRITDHPHLVRDTHTMGIINTNKSGYDGAKKRQELALQRLTTDKQQQIELNKLRSEVMEMKALLLDLLGKKV